MSKKHRLTVGAMARIDETRLKELAELESTAGDVYHLRERCEMAREILALRPSQANMKTVLEQVRDWWERCDNGDFPDKEIDAALEAARRFQEGK